MNKSQKHIATLLYKLLTCPTHCVIYRLKLVSLTELRHLIGNFSGYLLLENLTNLRNLKYAEIESWNQLGCDKLINLRGLHIEHKEWTRKKVMFTFNSIAKLKSLQILSIKLSGECLFALLQPLSDCPCLADLRLRGKIEKLPEEIHVILASLECLSLENSNLDDVSNACVGEDVEPCDFLTCSMVLTPERN